MAKGLSIMAMAVAVLVLLLFAMDLAFEFPFSKASPLMDIAYIVCALLLAYLSWAALKEAT